MANPLQMLDLKIQGIQFIQETPINAPSKKVWAAIAKPADWFYFDPKRKSKHTFQLKPGGNWSAVSKDGNSSLFGTVTLIEPGKLIRMSGHFGLTHLALAGTLIFELQPGAEKNTTTLRLGLRLAGFIDDSVQARYEGAWKMLAGQIKALAEKKK
jgi:uncharacterized protein YndB with AHSA1/START domain